MGTCFLSDRCHISPVACPAWLPHASPTNLQLAFPHPHLTTIIPFFFFAFPNFPLMSNVMFLMPLPISLSPTLVYARCTLSPNYIPSPHVFLISLPSLPFLLFPCFASYTSSFSHLQLSLEGQALAILFHNMGVLIPSSLLATSLIMNRCLLPGRLVLRMKSPCSSHPRDVFRVVMMVFVLYILRTSNHQATISRRRKGWKGTVGQQFDRYCGYLHWEKSVGTRELLTPPQISRWRLRRTSSLRPVASCGTCS